MTTEEPTHRRAWRAALLSLLVPGLGQLYAGFPRRAAAVGTASIAAVLVGIPLAMRLPGRAQLAAFVILIGGLYILPLWDTLRVMRTSGARTRPFARPAAQRWLAYALILIASAYGVQPLLFWILHRRVVEAYHLPSGAMEPTLLMGDYILTVPLRGDVERGQIVVYRYPRDSTKSYVKRVVGLPGDTLAMRDGTLIVNGRPVDEPYAHLTGDDDPVSSEFAWQRRLLASGADSTTYRPSARTWGPLVLSRDQYFILGDNRDQSADSRFMGPVGRGHLVARPTIVYFSRDPGTGVVRWERLGRRAG